MLCEWVVNRHRGHTNANTFINIVHMLSHRIKVIRHFGRCDSYSYLLCHIQVLRNENMKHKFHLRAGRFDWILRICTERDGCRYEIFFPIQCVGRESSASKTPTYVEDILKMLACIYAGRYLLWRIDIVNLLNYYVK